MGTGQIDDMEEVEHFTYYAFDGRTGSRRWKHEPGDFEDRGMHDEERREGTNVSVSLHNPIPLSDI